MYTCELRSYSIRDGIVSYQGRTRYYNEYATIVAWHTEDMPLVFNDGKVAKFKGKDYIVFIRKLD